jgi:hypothetical protein
LPNFIKDASKVDFSKFPTAQEAVIQSSIVEAKAGNGEVEVKGYAISGAGKKVFVRV